MKILKLISLSLILISAFHIQSSAQYITGEGSRVTETLDLPTITSIGLGISADVYVSQGSQSVKVKAQKNVIDNLKRKVKNGSWEIGFDERTKKYDKVEIWISVQNLENLSIGGSGTIIGEGNFKCDDLNISIGGSGDIELETNADEINVSIGGSGTVELEGSADELSVSIGGSGDINAFGLQVKECEVSAAGSGDINVHVTEELDVSLVGSGDVKYKGNPEISKSIIGSGEVERAN